MTRPRDVSAGAPSEADANAHVDALVIGAHPDDAELGAGGTLLRMRDAGLRVAVVDLTAGERGSRGTPELRAAEASAASAMLRLVARETLGFADTELVASLELRRALVEAYRRHRPRVVFAPRPDDLHPDHAAAGAAARDAFYPSGMKNLSAAGVPHRPEALYHYAMHDAPDVAAGGGVLVDVSAVWDERLALARCFASQLHAGPADAGFATSLARADFLLRMEARSREFGRRCGVEFAEPLYAARPLPVRDVGAFFGPGAR
ncbi:MAG: N-acetyl-alpha-D-glucosaminyl L-malate deacetylase 1 [Planctomycetes bacterium]|nr:N-acetyl-alpha-D-glucosaminyl L-malate deacetylase 1 [Planctomycetota bacterium]